MNKNYVKYEDAKTIYTNAVGCEPAETYLENLLQEYNNSRFTDFETYLYETGIV